jgi:two-component system NtrC family sensor kinase
LNETLRQHTALVKTTLVLFTIAIAILGVSNLVAQKNYDGKSDGIDWVFSRGGLIAEEVPSGSPGARAGIAEGDQLRSINFRTVLLPQDVGKIIQEESVSGKPIQYEIVRGSESYVKLLTPEKKSNSFYFYLATVGIVILAIGLTAFLKSRSRSFSLHFYWLCVAFFGTYVFSPTGAFDKLDWFFFWADEVFLLMLPPLFFHFACYFPGKNEQWIPKDKLFLIYIPSLFLLSVRIAFTLFYYLSPDSTLMLTTEGYRAFENLEIYYLFTGLLAGVVLLFISYARSQDIIQRKQLKLVLAGVVAGFGPFAFLSLVSVVVRLPQQLLEVSLLPQILIPISLTYALLKYRLMDVDIIIKRGMIYTVTTLLVFVLYIALTISWLRFLLPPATEGLTVVAASITTLLAVLLFQPLRDRIRALVDRLYYKDSYDYRRTLAQVSREITTSIDIGQLADSIIKHILSTFKVESADLLLKVGLNRFESFTRPENNFNPGLNFLKRLTTDSYVFEDSLTNVDADLADEQQLLQRLKFNYFIPCKYKHNIVAILALSKKEHADYLSSEDLDLLLRLANQLAIVIENHRLFYVLKKNADELERMKNLTENILLSLNVGIATLDENGKIVVCNQYIESFLGLVKAQIVGKSPEEIFPPEIVDRYRNYALKAPRKKLEGSRFYKTLIDNFQQKDHVLNLSFVPLINESDVEYGTILILDDVTHQAKLEEQLTQADKLTALGLLAAGVAHEVNTPLTGISSYTQMLQHETFQNPETKEVLSKIEQQTFRASKIINTLLDLSRQQPEPFTQIDVNNLVQETLVLLKPHFKDVPIEIVQEFDSSHPMIMGSEGRLQQVLTNLFLNAKDAMLKGGRLLARTEADEGQVVIDVVDSGLGISEKDLKRIYEPFFTTKKGVKGTGLGLAVSYSIIREHRGTIDVFSEEGRGTHFQIKLPKIKKEVHEQSRAYSGD